MGEIGILVITWLQLVLNLSYIVGKLHLWMSGENVIDQIFHRISFGIFLTCGVKLIWLFAIITSIILNTIQI